MSNYFSAFNTVYYANTVVTNILSRVKLTDAALGSAALYYPYEIRDGERPDHVAGNYYDDPNLDWIVYFSNKILDPYFEWPLTVDDLNKHIATKYGSIEEATQLIVFYRVNWAEDDSVISPAAYESLTPGLLKYWKPVFGVKNTVTSYERKQLDLSVETNKTISIVCTTSGQFIENERVIQRATNDPGSEILAQGQVQYANSTFMVLDKIVGEFTPSPYVRGAASTETATITSTSLINRSIPIEEEVYWSPVTAFSYEEEFNTNRRTIYLIDRRFVNTLEQQLRELLK